MQRWKRYSVALLMLFLASIARSQSTTVAVTVVDANSQAWAGGTISYQFRPNPDFPTEQYVWNGSNLPAQYLVPTQTNLDGSGHASFTIPSNAFIVPAGSTWTFVVCPNASIACTTVFASVAGSSIDLSSTINAALPPNGIVMSPTNIPKAYQDSEVKTVVQFGGVYYNTTTGCYRFWNGSTWTTLCGGGGGGSCPASAVPANAVLYSPSGTNCTGDGNFIYTHIGFTGVILNDAQDGSITKLLVEAQQNSTGGVGTNEVLTDGTNISVFTDGGGNISPAGMVGVDVESNDANYPGLSTEVLTGYQTILQPTVVGRPVVGYEAAIDMNSGSGKAATINGFQVDDNPAVQSTNFYGFHAKLLGSDATGDDFAFYAGDTNKANIATNFCDFYSTSSDPTLRVKLGCGPNSTNELAGDTTIDGEVDINGVAGVAGSWAALEGTLPSGQAGYDIVAADSVTHELQENANNTGWITICTAANFNPTCYTPPSGTDQYINFIGPNIASSGGTDSVSSGVTLETFSPAQPDSSYVVVGCSVVNSTGATNTVTITNIVDASSFNYNVSQIKNNGGNSFSYTINCHLHHS